MEVPLSDYLGWCLKASRAAVYWAEARGAASSSRSHWTEADGFRCLAALGATPPEISREALLPQWLLAHGALVRSRLTLTGLSAQEAEALLEELDTLGASLVAPIILNDRLLGFLSVGPPQAGDYDLSELAYLSLYGWSLVGCLERRRLGHLPKAQALVIQETKALREMEELWVSLRPRRHEDPLRFLILDEEAEAVASLSRFFGDWGFKAQGATSQEEALFHLKRFRPHLILLDLSLNRRVPIKLLEAVRLLAPEAILLGTAATRQRKTQELARGFGIQQIFPKPCRFAHLARWIFEAALSVAVKTESVPAPASQSCLIADNEQEVAEALQAHFETKGYQAFTATNPEETLQLVEKRRPELVLLDLKLPRVLSAELLRQIRKVSPLSRVILLTARIHIDHLEHPDATCVKPVPVEELDRIAEGLLLEESTHA